MSAYTRYECSGSHHISPGLNLGMIWKNCYFFHFYAKSNWLLITSHRETVQIMEKIVKDAPVINILWKSREAVSSKLSGRTTLCQLYSDSKPFLSSTIISYVFIV